MYDPDITGVGHQPLYFDNMTALYRHYTVLSSRIKVWAQSNTQGCQMAIYIDDDTTPILTPTQIMEQPSAVSRMIPHGGDVAVLTKAWNARQAFGGNTMDNDELQGSSSANPFEQQTFVTCFTSLAANATITYYVEIEYTAVWDELVAATGS